MNNYNAIFKIDDSTSLEMNFPCEKNAIQCCMNFQIYLKNETDNFLLYDYETSSGVDSFAALLKECINSHELNKSIKKDIGYLWNEYLHKKKDDTLEYITIDNINRWVGEHYLLWESSSKLAAWLYYRDGSIHLEITPVYKWHFTEPENEDNYISYDEFIKNYRPILTIKVDKDCAEQILKKTLELQSIIDKNRQKMHAN